MPDVFDMLIEEHNEAKQMIARLQESGEGDGNVREQTFAQLKDALEMHMRFEEKVVYPAMKKLEHLKDRVPEAVEEHSGARTLLKKLDQGDKADEGWLDTLKELANALEHHIEEEEEDIFPTAREELEEDKPKEMAAKYREMKREHKEAA
jgi:hemerythrin-like domain-containing protein